MAHWLCVLGRPTMIVWIIAAIAALLAATGLALYFSWANSGWLIDRRHALDKLDTLIDELDHFDTRFPDLGQRLHLQDVREVWPAQRAKVEEECSFVGWLQAGRPPETCVDRNSSALFQFARTQAGPLVWSMTQITEDPEIELINRIKAVISRDTYELRFSPPKARRLVPARRLSDI
jgi:hypothetical protein